MNPPRLLALVLVVGGALAGGSLRAAGPPPEADEVLHLPPMIVEGKNMALHWLYVAGPDLEVLTVCNDFTAREFVRRNHRVGELLRVLVPDRFLFRTSVPDAHILFNERAGRARSPEVLAEMARLQGATMGPDGTVVPRRVGEAAEMKLVEGPVKLTARVPRLYFLPNMRLVDLDGVAVFAITHETGQAAEFTLTDDRVEFLLTRRTPALPAWFIEGTLGLFSQSRFMEDEIRLRPLLWVSEDESSALARDPKRPRQLLPMEELLTRARAGAPREPGNGPDLWQSQCILFVRWAVAEDNPARREALWAFVDRLEREPLTEALFRECFGLGLAEVQQQLHDYLGQAVKKRRTLEVPPARRWEGLKPRPATELEIARIRGDWERLEIDYVRYNHPALMGKYLDQARTTLQRAYAAGERDPRLLVTMGLTELEAGDKAAARELLEAAVRGGKVRPRAALELARLRYAALPAVGELTPAQIAAALAPLYPGLQDAPPLVESYALLAAAWSRCATPPDAEVLARLNEGARFFPGASAYVLRVVLFNLVAGQSRPARALAEAGLRQARVPEMQERFRRVLAELPAE